MATTLPNPVTEERELHEQPISTAPQRRRRGHDLLTRLLFVTLALVAGYGGGRLHGWIVARQQVTAERDAATDAERERREELARASELLEQLRAQRTELANIASLYDGYRSVQLALNALDARNFGIAESQLRDAEHTLQPLSSAIPGLQGPLQSLGTLHMAVASDVGQQREAVRELAEALSALIGARRAASPAGAPQR
jgi:hypothetical protein